MQERQQLKLGQIEIENCTQRTVSIIARKGWGKSQILKMLAYSAPLEIPCYIFDPLGKIDIEGFSRILITRKVLADEAKLKQLPTLFSKIKEKKIIFAFKDLLPAEIVKFSDLFFQTWKPKNSLIFFDEMQEFVPERGMGLEYSVEIERAVRHWRNENDGFVFATQRPAFCSKKVLALTDFLILGAVTWNQDRKVVEELLSDMMSKEQTESVMQKVQTKQFLEGFTIDFI